MDDQSGPKPEQFDLLVVGQGYAGLVAAKLAVERGLRTANFEAGCMGGLIMNLNELDPAPAGAEHAGFELAGNLAMLNMEHGVIAVPEAAVSLERRERLWLVKTSSEAYAAPNVVVASGARLRKLGVTGEQELFGQGVSECADCDGPMFMDMETVVVGGGDSAFQEALALSQYAGKVSMIMRNSVPRARAELQERAAAEPKIVQIANAEVLAIEGEPGKGVERVRISIEGQGEQALPCAGVFVFIGLEPNTAFLPAELVRDASGALVVSAEGATSLPGLWAIGAVRAGFGGLLADAAADAERAISALT